jgi:hypothetical protein
MYAALALMMGSLYWKIENDMSSIQDRISILFFSVAFLCFMSVAAFPACTSLDNSLPSKKKKKRQSLSILLAHFDCFVLFCLFV